MDSNTRMYLKMLLCSTARSFIAPARKVCTVNMRCLVKQCLALPASTTETRAGEGVIQKAHISPSLKTCDKAVKPISQTILLIPCGNLLQKSFWAGANLEQSDQSKSAKPNTAGTMPPHLVCLKFTQHNKCRPQLCEHISSLVSELTRLIM